MTAKPIVTKPSPIPSRRPARRGVVALWTLLMLPVLLVMFVVVVEAVHLWLARVELENALEAAALAAVKDWAESGGTAASNWTSGARTVGKEYAAANTINKTSVEIDTNLDPSVDPANPNEANPNENETCDGHLIFGAITGDDPYYFESDEIPGCGASGNVMYAVRAQSLQHRVPSLIGSFLGINFGTPFTVSVKTTAMYDCELQRPRLIRVEPKNFLCTEPD
jgi:hypothetical protein